MDGQKTCISCKTEKILSCFYKHKQMADGFFNRCKECAKAGVKKNYALNKPQYQAYEHSRSMLPHRVEARQKYAETEAGKKSAIQSKEKWLENNRVKRAAQVIFGNWKRYNKESIPKSCESCQLEKRLHAHHDDYSKPLSVRYLCSKCHRQWHFENGCGANG